MSLFAAIVLLAFLFLAGKILGEFLKGVIVIVALVLLFKFLKERFG